MKNYPHPRPEPTYRFGGKLYCAACAPKDAVEVPDGGGPSDDIQYCQGCRRVRLHNPLTPDGVEFLRLGVMSVLAGLHWQRAIVEEALSYGLVGWIGPVSEEPKAEE